MAVPPLNISITLIYDDFLCTLLNEKGVMLVS